MIKVTKNYMDKKIRGNLSYMADHQQEKNQPNRTEIQFSQESANSKNSFIHNSQKCCAYVDASRKHYTRWKLPSTRSQFLGWENVDHKKTQGKMCFFYGDENVILVTQLNQSKLLELYT